MRDEAAIAKGEDTLTVLWDMDKFYDNICIVRLIKEAHRLPQIAGEDRGLQCTHPSRSGGSPHMRLLWRALGGLLVGPHERALHRWLVYVVAEELVGPFWTM